VAEMTVNNKWLDKKMLFHRQAQGKPNEPNVNSPYQEENHLTD
jgi:hypothetical protein